MRILITGSNGMLGSDLVKELNSFYEVCGLGQDLNRHSKIEYCQTDITNRTAVFKAVSSLKPAIIIHTAAYTDVDGCELNPHQAFNVNVKGTEFVGEASNSVGATLFFISSDYVFDGTKLIPYTEEDLPNPLSVYGRSKFEAEELLKKRCYSVRIIRSSGLFGTDGKNFFKTILQASIQERELRVVTDQKVAPTYTKHLAKGLRAIVEKGNRINGWAVYHLANEGEGTWFEAASRVLKKINSGVNLKPISFQELGRPANRPLNSIFDMSKIKKDFSIQLPSWEEAFNQYWSESLKQESQSLISSHSKDN